MALSRWYHNIKSGLINFWVYRSIIWSTREFDWAYLADLMSFKLRLMSDVIGSGFHVDRERNARQMRVCAELCKRIREDRYFENLAGPIEYRRWTTPSRISGYAELHVESYRNGKRMGETERKRLYKEADALRDYDIEYLFKIMRKHLLEWWD